MASKRRNMFYENKKQETTEIGPERFRKFTIFSVGVEFTMHTKAVRMYEHAGRSHPDGGYRKKGHYSTRWSRGQRLLSRRGGFKGWVEEDREDTRGLGGVGDFERDSALRGPAEADNGPVHQPISMPTMAVIETSRPGGLQWTSNPFQARLRCPTPRVPPRSGLHWPSGGWSHNASQIIPLDGGVYRQV
ncbi:hypothetical protein AAG570_005066 [Ranatra chinensis]|uniref:Uncharacterized protein n=1 Tax=Ranatra chinensis TaxID=642074 RepID=A0ABD0YL59_9HEMI